MRSTSAVLICLGAAGLTPCFADPPASTAASQPAATAASAPASAATPAAPATGQSPAEVKTASAQSSTPAAPTLDADERHLMELGYQPEMHNGAKLWCKRQQEIGSRLGSRQKVCGSAAELVMLEQRAQQQFQQQQAASVLPKSSAK
jgi:hypothetical protein